MQNLAPIALFVYNRPKHTKEVVEALLKNDLAAHSDLFVFSDGAKTPADQDSVNEVRRYVSSIGGFKSVTVVERQSNYGCAKSITDGVTQIVNRFGQIIVVEDDILTSPFFLRYMNDALDLYRNEEKVACIHGYFYRINIDLPETFMVRGADIWGWATWKRGWDLYEYDARTLLNRLKTKKLTKNLPFHHLRLLKLQIKGKINTWDIQWYVSSFLNDKLVLYPSRSLVQNIGYDSSGTHCDTCDTFSVDLSDTPVVVGNIPIEENHIANEAINRFLDNSLPPFFERVQKKVKRMARKVLLPKSLAHFAKG